MNPGLALAAELQKTFTTRMWWLLALLMAVYVGALAGGLGAFFGWLVANPDEAMSSGQAQGLPPEDGLPPLIYSFATSVGYVFPVLLGALAVTSEFRHRTLTPSFLAEPRRGLVLAAKFATQVLIGAGFGVIAFAVTVGLGAATLSAWGIDPLLGESDTWALIGRGLLAMALWAAIGVGLGSVVTNQVAAIVIVIAFTQFVEPILRIVASLSEPTAAIGRFLPGAASDALVGVSFTAVSTAAVVDPLEWWQGGLVLAAYAAVLAVVGALTSWRRDVS